MPKFVLNKLVRDGFRDEYKRSGQKAIYRELSLEEHKSQLIRKIVEEAQEINLASSSQEEVVKEIADIEQAIDDIAVLCDITKEQILVAKQKKYEKIDGFAVGTFVETIELADDDEWVEYYRKSPDIFPEV